MLFLSGFFVVLVGMAVLFVAMLFSGKDSANLDGIIFIGPIPIVIGIGSDPLWTVSLVAVLLALGIAVFLVTHRKLQADGEKAGN